MRAHSVPGPDVYTGPWKEEQLAQDLETEEQVTQILCMREQAYKHRHFLIRLGVGRKYLACH